MLVIITPKTIVEIISTAIGLVPAFVLGVYKSEAYIIHSSCRKIVILIGEKKKYSELDYELAKFIDN